MSETRIVITGGAGFIGSHLVERLAAGRAGSVLVLDNLHRACVDDPGVWPDGVTFQRGDVRDRATVEQALRGCEILIHLAAQSNVMGAAENADYAFQTNVAGTFQVLEAARAAGVKRMVFASSREVYGEAKRVPVPESAPFAPKNGYGVSKVAGELYCRLAAAEGLETVVLRMSNVYGARDRGRVIPAFLEAALAGRPLEIYGGDQILDFVWIRAVVDALIQAAFGDWIREPLNIGSGTGVRLRELAERITSVTGSAAPVRIAPARREEVRRFVADVRRAQNRLGLEPPSDPLAYLPGLLPLNSLREG